MKSFRRKALLLVGAACLTAAIPALSQEQEAPESLLPPGFGDPESLPPPENKADAAPRPTVAGPPSEAGPARQETPGREEEEELEELDELERPRPLNYFAIPEGAARPVDVVGILEPGNFGFGTGAFGRSHGLYLDGLIERLQAPLPSRWTSMLVRRALLSRLAAPPGMHPVDWVAARADLLLRMGEADAARMLVQSVDQELYTPRMVEVAADTALATADPAGLCPLVEPANSTQTVWKLADAMCAALEGEPARATALAEEARRRSDIAPVDYLLADKVIGAGAEARRAATIRWDEVNELSPWRFGLAAATGAEIPERLVAAAPPAMQAWFARAPMIPLEQRLGAASTAATLGVFSSQSLNEIYGLVLDRTDPAEQAGTVGARLRTAWSARDVGERVEALRTLWQESEDPIARYARLILTGTAASRVPVSADRAGDVRNLVAAMLAAGLDRDAARWSGVVQESGDEISWAMLAVAAPRPTVDIGADRIEEFVEADDSLGRRRSQMLVAALAGLERLSAEDASRLAASTGLRIGRESRWTAALDRAARTREPGTVALLAAVGMQTGGWSGVPPEHLFRIVRALRAVGLDYEARMIAAEAVARL